ncbi:LuxR C-terminal-related transcriptional regulator [Gordonia rhizosphera]|uniref:LuxR C-terminal-related transcriptional regulator n=1 Tax=Gordonia rhizosphera TaxID=83341 RepID=UPI001C3F3234|nr:LuxR C-terminal-related transcriptional regulator [Gordonia rhizosphera]
MEANDILLVETKLHAPRRRRGVVERARLVERLGLADLPALVLVSAPAGFGKTTLLTEWLGATGDYGRTAWVSLEHSDSDPTVFWSYVVAALQKVAPEVGARAVATLRSAPTALENVVSSLVNDLAALDDDLVLVLDDYHVIESVEVQESMRLLVDRLPAQTHLVVSSRADPPWPLGGMRARGDLLEIRATDLRFTVSEAATYLNDASGLALSDADVEALAGRTEAGATLDVLERSNLFVVALDDHRHWYRYHHLFADVLRARLDIEHPGRASVLHRRAADWFDAHGDRPEAVRHALAAQDFPKAAELVERAVPSLRRARQDATLREWLDAFPSEIMRNRPVLELGWVGAHMVTGDVGGVESALDRIEAWLDPERADEMIVSDADEFARLPAQAAMYRAGLALLRGDLAATITHGERAADLSATDDLLGRGAAAALIGLAQWARGDLESAARQYAVAIAAFEEAGYLADVLGCSLGLADIQSARGHLSAAERTLNAGLDLVAAQGPLRGTADMHLGLAEIHLERNEFDEAAACLQASCALGDGLALGQHAYRWRVVEARLRAVAGQYDDALALLREAERRYDTDYSPAVRPVSATIARVLLAAGDLDAAQRWAADSGLSADDDPDYLREYEHLTLAHVLLASGRAVEATRSIERLRTAAEQGGRIGSLVEALVLLALARRATDDPRAREAFDDALILAAPERLAGVFLDAGPQANALLQNAARHGRAVELAAAILAGSGATPTRQALIDPLTERERDVLRLLRTDLTGPEIAAELVVSLNTVRTHTKNIFSKLGVTNRRAAVRRADELGL